VVGGCTAGIGLLVGLIHVDLLVAQQFENSPSDADACPSAQVPISHASLLTECGNGPENIMKPLRILVADDHDLMRRGIKMLLQSHSGWEVCGEAKTGHEAVTKTEELKPDILILDISMPDLNGVEAARRIRKASPSTEILILSMHYSDQLVREIVEAGVRGFIVKSDSERDLNIAVETLANHKPFFTPQVTEVILGNFNLDGPVDRERLTSLERKIVQLVAAGKSCKEIAASLGITVKTTEAHRANLMRKLDLHSVPELVRYAVRNQIVEA
jgi:DNA-binding NarL/FixJ family response regulator